MISGKIYKMLIEFLTPKDFKNERESFKFIRERQGRKEIIYYTFTELHNSFMVNGIVAHISFDIVEDIIKKNVYRSNLFTIQESFDIENELLSEEIINSKEKSIHIKEKIDTLLNDSVFPFFKRYKTLKDVYEAIEKMPREQLRHFIAQPLPQRRMIIKWLCNDNNYQQYVDRVIEYYKSENDKDWKEMENLDKFLKTQIKPITNLKS
ncbi:hypothetical protein [Capnocytophaga canimorsus]|uniref:hypothetical protein n=1 Tax=Capnocytophaga canimorsus TaxID=28188 RepID=UPI0015623CB3|nr:hypothetical protein [Capnocytophaga canimorsus]